MLDNDFFMSCDWGTSAFRLRLIRINDLAVLAEIKNDHGIAHIYAAWQIKHHESREVFYNNILNQCIQELEQASGVNLEGLPVVVSGMASSSLGLMELPYKRLPFITNGSDLKTKWINKDQPNPLLLISGACTENDVMRGEETKIVGAAGQLTEAGDRICMILPGTHPKHIRMEESYVTYFKTFMTGEFFSLLKNHSVLNSSVEENEDILSNRSSFIDGVTASIKSSILHNAFLIRTNQLLKSISPRENYHFLSGLLVGEELKSFEKKSPAYLVGTEDKINLYKLAAEALGIVVAGTLNGDMALIAGQLKILMANSD